MLAEVCIPLLLLVALEMGFRWYVARTPMLPMPKLFPGSIVTGKYLAFREAAKRSEPIDLIVMGLSPMMLVNSQRMHDFLLDQGRDVGVFNFAWPLHSIDFDRCLLRDVVLRMSKPKVIVYGLMPFNLLYEPRKHHFIEAFVRTLPGFQLHEDTWTAPLRAAMITNIDLLLYQEVIADMLAPWIPSKLDPWAVRARRINRMGDVAHRPPEPPPQQTPEWEVEKYGAKMRQTEELMREGGLFQKIGVLAQFCRQHEMRLAVVNSDVSPFFLGLLPGGRKDYDEFVGRLRAAAFAAGAPFLDLSGPDLGSPETFVDTHHHNEDGATEMTDRIGAFLLREGLLDGPVERVGRMEPRANGGARR